MWWACSWGLGGEVEYRAYGGRAVLVVQCAFGTLFLGKCAAARAARAAFATTLTVSFRVEHAGDNRAVAHAVRAALLAQGSKRGRVIVAYSTGSWLSRFAEDFAARAVTRGVPHRTFAEELALGKARGTVRKECSAALKAANLISKRGKMELCWLVTKAALQDVWFWEDLRTLRSAPGTGTDQYAGVLSGQVDDPTSVDSLVNALEALARQVPSVAEGIRCFVGAATLAAQSEAPRARLARFGAAVGGQLALQPPAGGPPTKDAVEEHFAATAVV